MARRASDNPSCAWPTALLDRARGCAERRSRPRTSQFHLHSVVLVGHSYGGMVIRGVADRVPERVARLVFLDAFVPEHGQSALDLLAPERSAQLREAARTAGDGWRIPTQAPERYGVLDPADLEWARPRVGPQPLATLDQPMRITHPEAFDQVRRSYIACTEFDAFRSFAQRAQTEPGWDYREVASGHDAMIIRPRELADHLLAIAALEASPAAAINAPVLRYE